MSTARSDPKQVIREAMRAWRKTLTRDQVLKKSRLIQRQLVHLLSDRRVKIIGCYLSINNEVATDEMIDWLWQKKFLVTVPYWADTQAYLLSEWRPDDPTIIGKYGVREPKEIRQINAAQLDVIVCPGLAFSAHGVRLGNGRGNYDRILQSCRPSAIKIGVCFDEQLISELPQDKNDVTMDYVVTETRVLKKTEFTS